MEKSIDVVKALALVVALAFWTVNEGAGPLAKLVLLESELVAAVTV